MFVITGPSLSVYLQLLHHLHVFEVERLAPVREPSAFVSAVDELADYPCSPRPHGQRRGGGLPDLAVCRGCVASVGTSALFGGMLSELQRMPETDC